jgi:low temperature requirement protein LtrA
LELFKIRRRMGVAMQRIAWLLQIVMVVGLILGGFYYWARRQPDPAKRAVLLRRAGLGLMALSTFFFGAFIIGDTFADPGGWKAAGLVAAWAVPLAGLAALSWLRPAGRSMSWLSCRRQ